MYARVSYHFNAIQILNQPYTPLPLKGYLPKSIMELLGKSWIRVQIECQNMLKICPILSTSLE